MPKLYKFLTARLPVISHRCNLANTSLTWNREKERGLDHLSGSISSISLSLSTGGRKVGGSSPEFNRFVLNYPPLLFFFFSPSSARNCPPAGNFPLNRRENSLRRLRKGLKPFQIASLQFLLSFRR